MKAREREGLLVELISEMEARGHDTGVVMGGSLSGFLEIHTAAQDAV
jgi:hypothetical protein